VLTFFHDLFHNLGSMRQAGMNGVPRPAMGARSHAFRQRQLKHFG
jgi:hypothetical protein